jgi:hypothetical protein
MRYKEHMKISLIKTFIFAISMLSAISLKAQDYVITVKGDSIPCKVNKPLLGAYKYKGDGMSESVKIKPEVIKEFYFSKRKELYRSVFRDSTSDPVFMTVVEKGPISLYQFIYSNYNGVTTTTTTVWYVGKNSDNVLELKTTGLFLSEGKQSRKDALANMLADKKDVYDKYKAEDKFSFAQIRNIVHLYNTGKPWEKPEKQTSDSQSSE